MVDWRRVKKFWDWERWWDWDVEEDAEGSEGEGEEEGSCAGRVDVDAVVDDDVDDVEEGPAVEASLPSVDGSEPTSRVEEPWDA